MRRERNTEMKSRLRNVMRKEMKGAGEEKKSQETRDDGKRKLTKDEEQREGEYKKIMRSERREE